MANTCGPKHLKIIEANLLEKLKRVKKSNSDIYEVQQLHFDELLKIYQEAFTSLIDSTTTYSIILNQIKNAYEDALHIRNVRITQFITQDRVFGVTALKIQRHDEMKKLIRNNEQLKEQNLKLTLEVSKLKIDMGKLKDEEFSDYLALMRERDARYTLYFENLGLHMKLKELDGSSYHVEKTYDGDPVVLRIALDKCREVLASTQSSLTRLTDQYSDTVPRREHDALDSKCTELNRGLDTLRTELQALHDAYSKLQAKKRLLEEELSEVKDRCSELERAGTPRPHWQLCADFISGGRERWCQLAKGLSSREIMRVLLKELGPAAESEHLEHFDGLGTDPSVPAYLRHSGPVRNLRLSRRQVAVTIADVWRAKADHTHLTMGDYLTKYFEDRYQQPTLRAEWAYNLCASAEQMLEEPHVALFWSALHSSLAERRYWGLREHYDTLRDDLYKASRDRETVSIEEFERTVRASFSLKSEVDVKNLSDVVRKQLKMRLNQTEINLDKLFHETEEGFVCTELSRELLRQRAASHHKYIREVVAALPRARALVTVEALKRAFAIVDPAIDHIYMERYLRWAFSDQNSPVDSIAPAPLRAVVSRLAAADVERIGPRYRPHHRHKTYQH